MKAALDDANRRRVSRPLATEVLAKLMRDPVTSAAVRRAAASGVPDRNGMGAAPGQTLEAPKPQNARDAISDAVAELRKLVGPAGLARLEGTAADDQEPAGGRTH